MPLYQLILEQTCRLRDLCKGIDPNFWHYYDKSGLKVEKDVQVSDFANEQLLLKIMNIPVEFEVNGANGCD